MPQPQTLPPSLQPTMQRAVDLHRGGRPAEAAPLYAEVLARVPDYPEALDLRGVALSQLGRHAEALQSLQRAVQLQPLSPMFRHNLGRALQAAGQLEAAQHCFEDVLRQLPDFPEAHFNRANVLKARGLLPAAIAAYEALLRLAPQHPRVRYNLGNAYMETGRFRSAATMLRDSLKLRPQDADAWNNLAIALSQLDETDEVEAAYRRALQLRPDWPEALGNLAGLLEKQGRDEEAAPLYRRLLELKPDDSLLRLHVEAHCPIIAVSNAQIDAHRDGMERLIERYSAQGLRLPLDKPSGEPPFQIAYHGRDDLALKRRHAALFDGHLPQLQPKPRGSGQPHVGIVVTQGHEGVFIKCMRGIVTHMPQEHFRLSVVCGAETSAQLLRSAIPNPAVRFVSLPRQLDRALQVLEAEAFDLLHYWEIGTDALNYFLPFCRPARVQCGTWGWPVSSGIPQVDYFVSSELLEVAEADAHYSEKLVRLPSLPTYYYRPPVPEGPARRSRDSYGIADDRHAYFCLQNLRKVHPDMDPLFARILESDPRGELLLVDDAAPAVTAQLRRRLDAAMPQFRDRIRFLPRMQEKDFLGLVAQADVVLDTLHYTGGANTACDVFAAGTPTITLPTRYHRGRYTTAAYRAVGVEGCVAGSADEYVALALRYGGDRAEREAKSREILQAAPVLFEDRRAVTELADFFIAAMESS